MNNIIFFKENQKKKITNFLKQLPIINKKTNKNYSISSYLIIKAKKQKKINTIKKNYSFPFPLIKKLKIKPLSIKQINQLKKNSYPWSEKNLKIQINPLIPLKKETLASNNQNNEKNNLTKFQIDLYEEKIAQKSLENLTCKCKNTNCLKLFCGCFKTLGYCSEKCKCINCLNKTIYEKERNFVIKNTKNIFKHAFIEKKKFIKDYKGEKINCLGCICKKGCGGGYCACRKNGGKCSTICLCKDCVNEKVPIDRPSVVEIMNEFKFSRKKHKVVIDFDRKRIEYRKTRNLGN